MRPGNRIEFRMRRSSRHVGKAISGLYVLRLGSGDPAEKALLGRLFDGCLGVKHARGQYPTTAQGNAAQGAENETGGEAKKEPEVQNCTVGPNCSRQGSQPARGGAEREGVVRESCTGGSCTGASCTGGELHRRKWRGRVRCTGERRTGRYETTKSVTK